MDEIATRMDKIKLEYKEIQDRMLEAMKILTDHSVSALAFDRTIECVVVGTEKKDEGIYTVEYESARFDAYAKKTDSYYENEMVLVQIPQNDFNNQKTILGRREDENAQSKAYNFQFPFDRFVPLKQLTSKIPAVDMGYHANDPKDGNSLLYEEAYFNNAYLNNNLVFAYENIGETILYGTKLGIKVDVQTLLAGYDAQEGDYGFQILIKGIRKDEDGEATQGASDLFYFTNDNMYGNPYNYLLPMEQQIIIDVSSYKSVEGIYIAFWQDFTNENGNIIGSFRDSYGELIPYVDDTLAGTGLSEIPPNIIFENLEVYIGISTDEVDKDTLFIYTYDDMKYGRDTTAPGEREQFDKKTIYLTWVRLSDDLKDSRAIDTTEELKEQGGNVYWYVHDPDWHPDNEEYDETIDSHRFGGLFWRPLMHFEDDMSIEVIPDIKRNKARYKAVVHYDGTYITSDIISFGNVVDVEGMAEDLARNDAYILRISTYKEDPESKMMTLVPDDALGNFFVYDENNNVLANDDNVLFSDVEYYMEVWAKSSIGEDGKPLYTRLSDFIEEVEEEGELVQKFAPFTIDWKFPEFQTMIQSFEEIQRSDAHFSQRTDEQFERDKITTRKFKIKRTYNIRYGDNDINAVMERNGQTFTMTKEMRFGQSGSLGCEFLPVIDIVSPTGNYYIDTNSTYQIKCTVYDRRGGLLAEEDRANCKFDWKAYGGISKPTYFTIGNSDGFAGNVISGRQSTCEPFVIEVTVTGAADYPLTVRRGLMICNNSSFIQTHDVQCPDRVEFRSDGQAPKYYHNNFSVQTLIADEETGSTKFVYPDWSISRTNFLELVRRQVEAQTYIAPDGEEYKGQQHTEYALGFNGVKITTGTALSSNGYPQQWTDKLLSDEYFVYIGFTYGGATVRQAIAFSRNMYASSLVNEWDGQSLSLDEENSAVIAKMIAAGSKDSKNRFTGVMMGDWSSKADESLDVPGIYGFSSGLQTFGFKQDGTGFIGPSGKGRIHFDGRNALISNSDRTCYINLNPVKLDRYTKTIVDETTKKVTYEMSDDIQSLVNESGFTQYFLYCQVPQKADTAEAWSIADFDPVSNQYIDKTWAKNFINPAETHKNYGYDFFLVDPNYGVVTSGGIYARYGVLGKNYPWIISDSGLTQKNFYGTIFLGNPEYVSKDINENSRFNYSHLEDIEPDFDINQNQGEEAKTKHGMYSMVFTDNLSRIRTGVRADGYLYTEYATIGNWHINDYEMFVPSRNIDAKEEFEFRKEYRETKTLANGAPSYTLDSMNLNSYGSFIAFDQGRLLIDGKNGLMGFTKRDRDNPDGNYFTEKLYTMLIDLKDGTINFAKDNPDEDPRAQIDGIEGIAYFAKKNIILSGENATMYLGSPVKVKDKTVSTQTQGTIYLGQVKILGISKNEANSAGTISVPSIRAGAVGNFNVNATEIEEFDFNLTDVPTSEDGSSEPSFAGGSLQLWKPTAYTTIDYSESGGSEIQSNGICYIGYVDDSITIKDMSTSLVGGGLNIGIGGDAVILQPGGTHTEGYLVGDWNLNAKNITAQTVIMDDGYIKEEEGYIKIASQWWVYKYVADPLWSSIVQVNNLAAKALDKAYYGINQANKAIGQAIVGAVPGNFSTSTTYNITLTRKNGGTLDIGPFLGQHSHMIEFSENGSSITLTMSDVGPTGQTASFNMAATQWYKDRLAAIYLKSETVPGGIGVSIQQTGEGGGSGSAVGTAGSNSTQISATLDTDGKKVTVSSSLGGQFDIALADFYTAAYNAGWAAAAAGCGRSNNTVTYPTSTVGQKASATAHWYDTHSAGVSKTYKTVTEADVGTRVIDSAEGVLYGTSYFYWT